MTERVPTLQMIMEHVRAGTGSDCFKLWACRGEGRGCPRNKFRQRKVHCEDCVEASDENETIGEFCKRLERGNA